MFESILTSLIFSLSSFWRLPGCLCCFQDLCLQVGCWIAKLYDCTFLSCHPIPSPSATRWWEVSEQLESPSTLRRCSRFLLILSNFTIGILLSANANASPFPHRSWESCLLLSPQASARAWVGRNILPHVSISLTQLMLVELKLKNQGTHWCRPPRGRSSTTKTCSMTFTSSSRPG